MENLLTVDLNLNFISSKILTSYENNFTATSVRPNVWEPRRGQVETLNHKYSVYSIYKHFRYTGHGKYVCVNVFV